ncbi:MAG: translation initiation factor eIF-1A [Candidatus Micrarchaeota archaeon]|nr:translation initiation factor eIF-1A [Candidatus Micrarchaeota archaeon]
MAEEATPISGNVGNVSFTVQGASGEQTVRVRLPKEGEILGAVIGTVGGGRLQVQCKDGKERLCRIPGKIRRNIWVRHGDIVVVKPWSIDGDHRGDIVWRYNHLQADWLRNKGYVK